MMDIYDRIWKRDKFKYRLVHKSLVEDHHSREK